MQNGTFKAKKIQNTSANWKNVISTSNYMICRAITD